MASSDASRWNERYGASDPPTELAPPEVVTTHLADVGEGYTALDVASGWGDAGLFLATQGASTCLVDISTIALDAAGERARSLGVEVATCAVDLESEPVPTPPTGLWDAITCVHYLDRALLPRLGKALAPGGRLVCAIATTTNLERHERPSIRFLLEPEELPTLVPDMVVLHHSEGWRTNGTHEAWLVATP